jgi:Ion channel
MIGEQDSVGDVGFLVRKTKNLFERIKLLSPLVWLVPLFPKLRSSADAIEKYVLTCFLLELIIVTASSISDLPLVVRLLLLLIVTLRIIEIIQVTANVVLFREEDALVISTARIFLLAGINFIELGLCFGTFYALNYQRLSGAGRALTGYYLSFITQLTIGYGDVYPTGWLRVVAVLQGLTAALFVILVFGQIVASLQPIKSKH